jgi:hypothetical protein
MMEAIAIQAHKDAASIYEIELVSAAPVFEEDFDLNTGPRLVSLVDTIIEKSFEYWLVRPKGYIELLIGGDVRVLRRIVTGMGSHVGRNQLARA